MRKPKHGEVICLRTQLGSRANMVAVLSLEDMHVPGWCFMRQEDKEVTVNGADPTGAGRGRACDSSFLSPWGRGTG